MSTSGARGPVPAPGTVGKIDGYAVGNVGDATRDDVFAVARRCRHQLADLSEGSIDADGCLVCPWHQSRYDVNDGRMVTGPRGFLGYRGPTPGYSRLVRAYSRVLRLRVRRARVRDGHVELD